jgi:death-on-curing protein
VLDAAHLDQLREHGGLPGIRDENGLEAALARARQRWSYERKVDIADLAAVYGHGIATGHPYRDGNKRAAFLAMAIFLGLNGYELEATEPDVVTTILRLAAGGLSEQELAAWVREHLRTTA